MRNLNIAKYQKREHVTAPLDIYNDTLDTLQQKHDKAIDQTSAIKTFIANKDLNESESKWASDYAANIESKIQASVEEGSYATALTTVKKLAGDVASDVGLLGREKAQAAYKTFVDNVDSNKNINPDAKAFTKAMTKYSYNDVKDDTGKIVGGSTWSPNYNPVESVDINKLYEDVLRTVGVDQSQGGNLVWGDSQGNIKHGMGNVSDGDLPYFKTESGVTKLDPNKIKIAMQAAIESAPGARASLDQDYKVNVWKASKKENNSITKKDGTLMSQKEFEESLVMPRYKASAYTRVTNDINTSIGFSMMEARNKTSKKASEKTEKPDKTAIDFGTTVGNVKIEADTPAKITSSLNTATTSLGNYFAKYGIDKSGTIDQSYTELRRRINQNQTLSPGIRERELAEADAYYDDINKSKNKLEAMRPKLGKDEEAVDFIGNRLSSGSMSDAKNTYQAKWAEGVNRIFTDKKGNSYNSIIMSETLFSINNKSMSETAIRLKKELGLSFKDCTIKNIDGKNQLYISKDAYSRLAPEISSIVGEIRGDVYNDSNGTIKKDLGTRSRSISSTLYSEGLFEINREAERLSAKANKRIAESFDPTYVPLQSFNVPVSITVDGKAVTKNILDDYTEGALNALSITNGGSVKVLALDDSGELTSIDDSNERTQILRDIQLSKKDVSTGWGVNPSTGEYGMIISRPRKENTKGSVINEAGSYFISGAVLNSEISKFKDIPEVRAVNTLNAIKYNSALASGYTLSDNEWGDGSYKAKIIGNEVLLNNGSNNFIMTLDEAQNVMANNYKFKASIKPIKSLVERIQSNDMRVSDLPVEQRTIGIITPLLQKAMIDNGIDPSVTDINELSIEGKQKVLMHFTDMYNGITGEPLTNDVQDAISEILK